MCCKQIVKINPVIEEVCAKYGIVQALEKNSWKKLYITGKYGFQKLKAAESGSFQFDPLRHVTFSLLDDFWTLHRNITFCLLIPDWIWKRGFRPKKKN